jgi:TolB-like protein/Tfp pilus assembly protein PilF/tRNA A-37 threonylcarbamoyl transferase component Bud32
MTTQCPKCKAENPDESKFCNECGLQLDSIDQMPAPPTQTIEAPKEELTRGTTLANRYEIIEELGKGGMGRVYRVEDTKLKQEVALKLIKPEIVKDKKTIERFGNELKLARNIRHKNVCGMFDLGEAEGAHFITMEYVSGEDLKSFIRRVGQLPSGKAISIAKQICDGLLEAHRLEVIHRDLKPSNIMIDNEGNARIMDFGIARSLESKGITGAGVMIGTPEYMSPEQVEGKETDQRSDIYSFGVILYEMVTGRVPFEGDTALTIAVKHKTEEPKDPREFNTQLSEDISRVILKCLEKEKDKRYQSAGEVRSELTNIEKGIPTTERVIPERKPLTSREITVTLGFKKVLVPALVFIGIVIVGVIIWQLLPKKEAIPVALSDKPSLAVLPFVDLSPKKEHEYLCDGIAETLINALSGVKDLHVPARTSAFYFKDKDMDIREIGQKLNVEAVLEGSVQVVGDRLRMTARLSNVTDGYQLWSENYERGFEDVFTVQDDIAQEIVKALKIKLIGEEEAQIVKHYTDNREAYDFYIKGLYFWNKRDKKNLEKALEYFQEAIENDPTYALAYSGLADTYIVLADNIFIPASEAFPKAKAAAMKALEIDDSLAEAHISLAAILESYDWDFAGAEREYQRAIDLKPGYATAHQWYALHLSFLGRYEEAIVEILRARELDPLSPRINANVGQLFFYARKNDRALEELKKSTEIFPEHLSNYIVTGLVYAQIGRYEDAISSYEHGFEISGRSGELSTWLAYIYALSGKRSEARKRLNTIIEYAKQNFVSPIDLASVYVGLGEKEEAFSWLEKGYSEKDAGLPYLKANPVFDPLRSDPRFKALLKKVGLDK